MSRFEERNLAYDRLKIMLSVAGILHSEPTKFILKAIKANKGITSENIEAMKSLVEMALAEQKKRIHGAIDGVKSTFPRPNWGRSKAARRK